MQRVRSTKGEDRAASRGKGWGKSLLVVPAATFWFGTATALPAADAEPSTLPEGQVDNGTLEEIVVTALKRSTAIQSTPISISAITGDALVNSGVQNIAGLSGAVPSLTLIDGGPGSRRVVIRGIQSAGEPTVGVYYDETPVSGSIGSTNDAGRTTPELRLFDVERVEVLRGPQGTLYGAGSMGGTLRIIYKKPSFEHEAGVDASTSVSEHGGVNYEANGVINVPLVDDKLALRIVGSYNNREGYIDNVLRGQKNVNDEESWGSRVLLRFTPFDALTLDLAAYINRTEAGTPSWIKEAGRYQAEWYTEQPFDDDIGLYSLTANWDLSSVALTGTVSYYDRNYDTAMDVTRFLLSRATPVACQLLRGQGSPCSADQQAAFNDYVSGFVPGALFPQQGTTNWTGELRLSSTNGSALNWTIGSFYSNRHSTVDNPLVLADAANGDVIFPLVYGTRRGIDDRLKQIAGFGEVSLDLTEALNLTAGARYFQYEKDIVGETSIPLDLIGAFVTPPTHVESDENGWVFRLNGSYKLSGDVMVYAEASQGFRPGGANQVLGLAEALTPYRSDSLWNYELGIKSSWFDKLLTLNADVYQIDWDDIQVQGTTPGGEFGFISNAGAARIRGVELELTARLVDGLLIQANAAHTNAKLTEDQVNANVNAAGRAGDRIPYIPRYTAGASVQYNWPMSDALEGLVRFDASHIGSSYSEFQPGNPFRRKIDAYQLVNLRTGVEAATGRWGAYLFVINLFNDEAITSVTSAALYSGRTVVYSAQPRTFGVNFRKSF